MTLRIEETFSLRLQRFPLTSLSRLSSHFKNKWLAHRREFGLFVFYFSLSLSLFLQLARDLIHAWGSGWSSNGDSSPEDLEVLGGRGSWCHRSACFPRFERTSISLFPLLPSSRNNFSRKKEDSRLLPTPTMTQKAVFLKGSFSGEKCQKLYIYLPLIHSHPPLLD